jgi:hypothetical protein
MKLRVADIVFKRKRKNQDYNTHFTRHIFHQECQSIGQERKGNRKECQCNRKGCKISGKIACETE